MTVSMARLVDVDNHGMAAALRVDDRLSAMTLQVHCHNRAVEMFNDGGLVCETNHELHGQLAADADRHSRASPTGGECVETNRVEQSTCDAELVEGEVSRLRQSASSQRLDELRDTVGDFGLALFAPLLDLTDADGDFDHSGTEENEKYHIEKNVSPPPSSCNTVSTQTDDSDYSRWRHDDDDSDYHVVVYDDYPDADIALHVVFEPPNHLSDCPRILSSTQMQTLRQYLPHSVRDRSWDRCFCIGLHGDSFCTLLQKCAPFKYSMVVIRTIQGEILGGFASETWRVRDEMGPASRHAYYGCGQSFVFGSHPAVTRSVPLEVIPLSAQPAKASDELTVYNWTGDNDYCQICDNERRVLCMGGVGDFGWIVSEDFASGQTGPCATFGNPALCQSPVFAIADFEIYGFAPSTLFR